jgi:hypothetical protein
LIVLLLPPVAAMVTMIFAWEGGADFITEIVISLLDPISLEKPASFIVMHFYRVEYLAEKK